MGGLLFRNEMQNVGCQGEQARGDREAGAERRAQGFPGSQRRCSNFKAVSAESPHCRRERNPGSRLCGRRALGPSAVSECSLNTPTF
jgi:hypothetical protein